MTVIYDNANGNGLMVKLSLDKTQLAFWADGLRVEPSLGPEEARDLALALLRWSSEHGAGLVWANLPGELHEAAKKHGLVQVQRTDTLEANIGLRGRHVACRLGDLVVYGDEICGAGTCLRPPGHDGRHDQFDSPPSSDAVPFHKP